MNICTNIKYTKYDALRKELKKAKISRKNPTKLSLIFKGLLENDLSQKKLMFMKLKKYKSLWLGFIIELLSLS